MSRRSQQFADGVQKFSWLVEPIQGQNGEEQVKVTCKNFPSIVAIGNTEQTAIHKATRLITEAAEKSELGTANKHVEI